MTDLFDFFTTNHNKAYSFLPYDLYYEEDGKYVLEMAVSGYTDEDIEIEWANNRLKISGKREKAEDNRKYLYRNIAKRDFKTSFSIARNCNVTGAKIDNGILKVFIEHIVPEEEKPKLIQITK